MKYWFFPVLFFALTLMSGCDGKSCKDIVCGNNEICANGGCFCNDGYYGQNCDQLTANKFANQNYYVTESCQSGTGGGSGYYAYIYPGGSVGTVTIGNFLGQGYEVVAYLKGDANKTGDYLYIPEQSYSGSGSVQGEGYYNPATYRISFNLNYTYGLGASNSCTQTFQRQ